jgi:hypothetical protein
METFEVRDYRKKEMFRVDDEYLNGYSKLCGTNATLVYLCLCRHSDRHQESFPSIQLMAEKLGISRDSIIRGIKSLVEWNIIQKNRKRKENQQWLNNTYILLDKSVWKSKPSRCEQLGEPSRKLTESQVAVSDTKVTHIKETHIATEVASEWDLKKEIQKLMQSERRELRIIGWFINEKKITLKNREQLSTTIKRHLRPAKLLIPFEVQQIKNSANNADRQIGDKWTLETLYKLLTK